MPLSIFNIFNSVNIFFRTGSILLIIITSLLAVLISTGFMKISGKIKQLKKEKYLRE